MLLISGFSEVGMGNPRTVLPDAPCNVVLACPASLLYRREGGKGEEEEGGRGGRRRNQSCCRGADLGGEGVVQVLDQ